MQSRLVKRELESISEEPEPLVKRIRLRLADPNAIYEFDPIFAPDTTSEVLQSEWSEYKSKIEELYALEVSKTILTFKPNTLDVCRMMTALESRGIPTIKNALIKHSQSHPTTTLQPQYPSLTFTESMAQRRIIEEDYITPEVYEAFIEREIKIEQRLVAFTRTSELSTLTFTDLLPAPCTPIPSLMSILLSESSSLVTSLASTKKHLLSQSRKLSKAIEKHFDQRHASSLRVQKTSQKQQQKLAKMISSEIKKRWKAVEEICRARYKAYLHDIEKAKGEVALERILEDSSRMLGGQTSDEEELSDESEDDQAHNLQNWMEEYDLNVDETAPVDVEFSQNHSEITDDLESESDFDNTSTNDDILYPVPFMLKHTLREYQYQGMKWLAKLYDNDRNGILADEMGLGKTIQTIALLAHLACTGKSWGPHLIIVPTSVLLNWTYECPGFKVLTYYGSQKERKLKREGWSKPNAFNICITSYQIAIQDARVFKNKRWVYMCLDEAQHIKSFKSLRWQTLLTFNAKRRLLITGTPISNNLMELWSLLYFLVPSGPTMKEFQAWFAASVNTALDLGMSDKKSFQTIQKLHTVLRPYLLRRTKAQVEKQMPLKYEHVVYCRLSNRQRLLYDDFMSRGKTKDAFTSGSYFSILSCVMQLRKVCNHPDLFETRPIVTSFVMGLVSDACEGDVYKRMIVDEIGYRKTRLDCKLISGVPSCYGYDYDASFKALLDLYPRLERKPELTLSSCVKIAQARTNSLNQAFNQQASRTEYLFDRHLRNATSSTAALNLDTVSLCTLAPASLASIYSSIASSLTASLQDLADHYIFLTPNAITTPKPPQPSPSTPLKTTHLHNQIAKHQQIFFPDKSLLQYDCGKLQTLHELLKTLKDGGHRVLIFTQMSKMLDIFEVFLNSHGYRYVRLDGSTKVEQRKRLMDQFNNDNRIFVFILSTRAGGIGLNLTGADTVIFYDSDWNPQVDLQAMDRAHRIGQTRDVHIYRLVSTHTIEENVLRKAQKKQALDAMVIGKGDFTTGFLGDMGWSEWMASEARKGKGLDEAFGAVEDEADVDALKMAMKEGREVEVDFEEEEQGDVEVVEGGEEETVAHIEDFMFSTMLTMLGMSFPLTDFQL